MTWQDLPITSRAYILLMSIFACPIVGWAAWDILQNETYNDGWLVLTVLTLLTVPFFLFLPSVNTIIGIGDAYIMAVSMIYGPSPCIIATVCHTLTASLFAPNRPKIYGHRVIFNISSMVCGAWVYSTIYELMNPLHSTAISSIVLPAVVLTCVFFVFNSLSTATAISLSTGQPIIGFWLQHYLPLAVDFSVSSVSATFIVALHGVNDWAPLAAAPLVGVVWGWNKVNKSKVMEAERHLREQEALYLRTVESLALAVDAKDQTTYGHIRRVRAYALGLAKLSGISDTNELMAIETGSLLHDIGKLAIDDYILNKPGRLTKQEFEKMKLHSTAGDEILKQIEFPFPVAMYVRCHHERWDGTGYPDGIKGEEIPLGARILSIADAFDAIRSSRPYKMSFGIQDAIDLLRAQAGTVYDPKLVELFIKNIDALEKTAAEAAKNVPELSFRKTFEKADRALADASTAFPNPQFSPTTSAELVSLYEFSSSLGRHLELSDILVVVSLRLKHILPFTTCIIYLDNGEDQLRAEQVSGQFSDSLQGYTVGVGKGISGWVAAYKRPILNTGPALEFQDFSEDLTSLSDALVVPLVFDEDCIGTISLFAQSPIFYTQAHLGLLQIVANQVSPLLHEARVRTRETSEDRLLDPTTQAYRVSYLSVAGSQMIDFAEKNQTPLSLLYLDLKNLSQLVNLYGVHTGEAILRRVSQILKAELRDSDILVRFGHEGFVALLAGVRVDQASRYAQRLLQQIRNTPVGTVVGHNVYIVCQAGIASYPKDGTSIFSMVESAQRPLADRITLPSKGMDGGDVNVLEFPPRT